MMRGDEAAGLIFVVILAAIFVGSLVMLFLASSILLEVLRLTR